MDKWFSALMELEAEIGGLPQHDGLCEASVRLFRATDVAAAQDKAEVLGRQLEHDYLNENGEPVVWRFRGVIDVQEVEEDSIVDGVEVFSRLYRKTRPDDGGPFVVP